MMWWVVAGGGGPTSCGIGVPPAPLSLSAHSEVPADFAAFPPNPRHLQDVAWHLWGCQELGNGALFLPGAGPLFQVAHSRPPQLRARPPVSSPAQELSPAVLPALVLTPPSGPGTCPLRVVSAPPREMRLTHSEPPQAGGPCHSSHPRPPGAPGSLHTSETCGFPLCRPPLAFTLSWFLQGGLCSCLPLCAGWSLCLASLQATLLFLPLGAPAWSSPLEGSMPRAQSRCGLTLLGAVLAWPASLQLSNLAQSAWRGLHRYRGYDRGSVRVR